jgi:putative inorganic carbon (hco3(-)) transporter
MQDSVRTGRQVLAIVLVLLYLAADLIMTMKEIYVLNLLPVILLLVYLAFARLDVIYLIIVFCTPLSIQFIEFVRSSPVDFAIPTEPMLFGVMLIFWYKIIGERQIDRRILNHPVTLAILFNLFWLLITAITSTMPMVSFKFLLARIWFITIYYLLAIQVFRVRTRITTFIWVYTIAMLGVVSYTIVRHMRLGIFDKQVAHFVMSPFFRDHTSYGAVLAMLLFGVGGIVFRKGRNLQLRFLYGAVWVMVGLALLLSYTRAAWISVIAAGGVLALTLVRVRFRYILFAGVLVVMYLAGQRTEIVHRMQQNRQASSASIAEHVRSMSNISTDESNLERLNRWNSALRMFREKPVFGWGPGTYKFKYAPFQISSEKTAISTDLGEMGNAHSEYIGPLAESGLLGSLSFIAIAVAGLITGFRVFRRMHNGNLKNLVLALILGLITYLIHGTLNNFLDTDKASALFWGYIAVFVSLDIFGNGMGEAGSEELNAKE